MIGYHEPSIKQEYVHLQKLTLTHFYFYHLHRTNGQ